ncbi:DNA repair protein Rad50 [Pseudozyma hubeiensis SY62]|uniref:DNA repair protein Rad50 n=1 Tax=Pseudozyma hubeiensis (strain SY62) TaxID=1305764 RepID=R9NW07_PSEHS|nr:DNA repair protein Rad50 [Pseudozyma hubeiensis SY62]GAC92718.1 DNA repair protein Rad50 [Pseudozyma hubeiensis SY62]
MSAPSLSFAHTVELDCFLQEANVTTTDLFAVLGDSRYRETFLKGVRAVVADYKKRGRQPPPMYFTSPQSRQQPAESPVKQEAPSLPTPSRVGDQGSDDDIRTPPIPHLDLPLLDIVPGSDIKLRDLTAPQLWTCLHDTTLFGSSMSFLARVAQHTITRDLDRLVTLDLGRGEFAVLQVSNKLPIQEQLVFKSRFPVGSIVHILNVTRLDVGRFRYLNFAERSSIRRLDNVNFEVVERVNSQLNRNRKRSYAEVVVEEVRSSSAFLDQRSRRVRERFSQG